MSPDSYVYPTGTMDVSSAYGPIVPWLRSIDGFNTHDDAMELAIAGGVTSIQALPGETALHAFLLEGKANS